MESTPRTFNAPLMHSAPFEKDGRTQLASVHPLKNSEENVDLNRHTLNMKMLREREGLSAPLKITMELNSMKKVGRLPFLASSNVHRDVLLGRDEVVEFSDFLNVEEMSEFNRQPHAVVEKSLNIL